MSNLWIHLPVPDVTRVGITLRFTQVSINRPSWTGSNLHRDRIHTAASHLERRKSFISLIYTSYADESGDFLNYIHTVALISHNLLIKREECKTVTPLVEVEHFITATLYSPIKSYT